MYDELLLSDNLLSAHSYTIEEVTSKTENLDTNKDTAPDGVPLLFLKPCVSVSAQALQIFGSYPQYFLFSNLVTGMK